MQSKPKTSNRVFMGIASVPLLSIASLSPVVIPQVHGAVLEEVIVTARKREEAIQDVPVSITALTGDQLRDAGITNIKDLGYQVPGLQIDQSSGAQIWIRGIGQRDDGSRVDAPVGVYIDGLYIPRKDGQLLDLIDVQSVQVLRGPQGTLFGKNTTAGALVVTTVAPEPELSGFAEVRLGNYNRQDFKGAINVPLIEDKLLSKVTLGTVNRDGYQHNITTGQDAASEDRKSAALQLSWVGSERFTASGFAYWGDTDEVQPTTNCRWMERSSFNGEVSLFVNRIWPGDLIPVDAYNDNDTPVRDGFVAQSRVMEEACRESERLTEDYKTTTNFDINYQLENLLLGVTLEWEISDDLSLKSITGYGDQEKAGNFGNPDNDASALPISSRFRKDGSPSVREHYSQEFQLIGSAFDDRLDYTFGLYAMQEDIDDGTDFQTGWASGSYLEPLGVMVINDATAEEASYELENTTYAAFFQGSFDITDNLELTAGVRWTSERRKQSVELFLLDVDAYRNTAFGAIAGAPGITLLQDLGIGLVNDIDALMAADIFATIDAAFPHDSRGNPIYQLIAASELVPDIDEDADETWEEVTPMVSLAYHLPDSALDATGIDSGMFYFSYAEGFKSGTFEPVGVDGQATVEPEKVQNLELGFKLDFLDSRMRLNGAVFRTDFDDMQLRQVLLDGGGTPRVVLDNASKTRITGTELELAWTPIDNLLFNATLSYNDYEYLTFDEAQFSSQALFDQVPLPVVSREDEPFAEVPELTYTFAIQYRYDSPIGTWVPQINYSYVDEIFMGLDAGSGQNLDQSSFDDYSLVNMRLGWVSPSERFEGALYVSNVTDEFYYFGAAAVGDSTGNFQTTSAPPRMYGFELRYNFF